MEKRIMCDPIITARDTDLLSEGIETIKYSEIDRISIGKNDNQWSMAIVKGLREFKFNFTDNEINEILSFIDCVKKVKPKCLFDLNELEASKQTNTTTNNTQNNGVAENKAEESNKVQKKVQKIMIWDASPYHDYGGSEYSGTGRYGNCGARCKYKYLYMGKDIKYLFITFQPYNAVNDPVEKRLRLQMTGPIKAVFQETVHSSDTFWWNPSIETMKVVMVEIEYMDGEKETIPVEETAYVASNSGGGCYVATAVYGSYNCPQVWTLRRYRDNKLAKTWYGRAFIHTYYAISPTLVKWFGETKWFKKMWKGKLDAMVSNLNAEGIEDTPYEDQVW